MSTLIASSQSSTLRAAAPRPVSRVGRFDRRIAMLALRTVRWAHARARLAADRDVRRRRMVEDRRRLELERAGGVLAPLHHS